MHVEALLLFVFVCVQAPGSRSFRPCLSLEVFMMLAWWIICGSCSWLYVCAEVS